jgi:hypothetical protein
MTGWKYNAELGMMLHPLVFAAPIEVFGKWCGSATLYISTEDGGSDVSIECWSVNPGEGMFQEPLVTASYDFNEHLLLEVIQKGDVRDAMPCPAEIKAEIDKLITELRKG